ncbi:folylpolyglutamate synthase, mitochondrial-like [Uloborus diversus]|uniref:folylpolyglutamate synthase, mitochondrial-like n=1 Tax=Uloborus diversus TaxID=327109 RepID=UPI00240940DE|nr:folylpolyglutamate synthase, mitochondrial-like [Uloborus diversus]
MSSNPNLGSHSSYEEAVYALNGLQSNAVVLKKAREERNTNAHLHIINTKKHLTALGIHLEDLDALNIIHVSGTKGKGSTCAFTESIIRTYGYKTGFYSSPHLISVNERIRINGQPLSKEEFAKYFWEVYRSIQSSLKNGESMPTYFLFLTVMAFYVFVKEKVHAAVVEVGVGGLYDCTNVIRKPVVVGVTSLGFDHVNVLGHTITEIAAQKAGIFKTDVPAFTVPQPENAIKVLQKAAQNVNCPLVLAPPLEAYDKNISLGIPGIVQNVNASLALQLARVWLSKHDEAYSAVFDWSRNQELLLENSNLFSVPLTMASPYILNSKIKEALVSSTWPGRFQVLKKPRITFYLDGAHTQQSMKYCARWFNESSETEKTNLRSSVKVLLFNCTGERKAESLLDPLADINFDAVVFTPNRISVTKDSTSDQSNFTVDPEKEIDQCVTNREIWCHLMRSLYENKLNIASYSTSVSNSEAQARLQCDNSVLFSCLKNAVDWLFSSTNEYDPYFSDPTGSLTELLKNADHIQILITGSLHLVGNVLGLIEKK